MQLTFFSMGSGSCGNCYYLATKTDAMVIDCGISLRRFKRYMQEYGMKIGKVRGVLITHDHADHIKAAGKLSKDLRLPVFATAAVHAGMDRNWQATVKVPEEYRHAITPGTAFTLGEFNIEPFSLPHDASENVGYHITVGDIRLTLMTDVGAVTDNMKHYIGQSTHLILESNYDEKMLADGRYPEVLKQRIASGTGHLSNNQAALALATNCRPTLQHVWLCHLSEENNTPDKALQTMEDTLRKHNIEVGTDFKLDALRRKIPTNPFVLGSDK